MRIHRGWKVLVALLAPIAAQAQGPGRRCDAPEYRQFDFWLGDWEVRDGQGKLQGHNRITREYDGCVVQEHWTATGQTGSSFNIYDARSKKWHQTWVDSGGTLLLLDGGLDGNAMLLTSPGGTQRIRFTPLPDGRVRQLWETTDDGGKSWKVKFDGYYAKKK
jgi:hypothetical protein